ncbi:MAG: hypothetical protein M3545_16320 [Acidobacteriota bacterium]|nr:hypothetical protein [Acidobacteriota bacterium]
MARAQMLQAAVVTTATLWQAGCGGSAPVTSEPLPGVPPAQQRTITRNELGYQWPFTVGVGTIACDDDILAFRSGGTTYALHRGVGRRGYANVDAIRRVQGSGPPSDPVSRLTQDVRTRVFAETSACGNATDVDGSRRVSGCKARLRARTGVSDTELIRIEAEGVERNWPPLKPVLMNLDVVIAAATQLCPR